MLKCYFLSIISQINFITGSVQAPTHSTPGKNLLNNKKANNEKQNQKKLRNFIIFFREKVFSDLQ